MTAEAAAHPSPERPRRRSGDIGPAEPRALARTVAQAAVDAGALLLCTDFDGSLAPITPRPEDSRALPAASAALGWLSRDGARRGEGAACPVRVAVVTARDSADAARRIGLGPEAVVCGNYGLERTVNGGTVLDAAVGPWIEPLAAALADLEGALAAGRCPGVRLERKRCGLVLHTRGLHRPGIDAEAAALAQEVAAAHGMAVAAGKRAVEVHPPIPRDKSSAVRALRRERWEDAALCVAGDDLGDVPMLRLASDLGDRGVAIAVADTETPAAVVAAAERWVDGPWGWAETLSRLVETLRR